MKQILQNLKSGETMLEDVPVPGVKPGHLLIHTSVTLISAGTERMLVEFGRASFVDKARQQPDKVRMVLEKVKTDGLLPTIDAVRNKLDQPLTMGYCNVGRVLEVGAGVNGFSVGDRVVSNGKHAEVVCVPRNLCAKIPEGVSDEAAAFTVIGAIALQGVRLAQPTLGEAFVVTGMGLIGLLAAQCLRAAGCRVLGVDFDPKKLELARALGAETVDLSRGEDPIAAAQAFSRGRGVDGVLVTAATQSSEPMHQAAVMCRKRGRIVLVGVAGLELSRADFYEKELSFQVSCSYGPGRYDPIYEEGGQDYPFGFVRWTEQRNFEAVLDLMGSERMETGALLSHRFELGRVKEAYDLVAEASAPSLGILLEFPKQTGAPIRTVRLAPDRRTSDPARAVVGFIGSGNFAGQVLAPAFAATGARLRSIASATGVSGVHVGKKTGFEEATTDTAGVIRASEINTIVVATRHDTHARFVCDALLAGKHVFVEKPLAITREELAAVEKAYAAQSAAGRPRLVGVGFNRRFAPQVRKIKELLGSVREPKSFVMTVNAGAIPSSHWTQDLSVGGGRIIGEGCHFVDLLRFLAGAPITRVQAMSMGAAPGLERRDDKVSFTLGFADGSFGTVHYLANGHKSFPKERLEVFCGGAILLLDNFRKLTGFGWPGFSKMNLLMQDKGHRACAAAFIQAVEKGESAPVPFEELVEVTRAGFDVVEALGI